MPAYDFSYRNFFPTWRNSFWAGAQMPAYYFSYRIGSGYGTSLRNSYDRKLNIHEYSGSSPYDFYRPFLMGGNGYGAGLEVGGTFRDENVGLVATFISENSLEAKVKFCPAVDQKTETNFVDGDDPACKNYAEVCGNKVCAATETAATCPGDCPPVCGDGLCTHAEVYLGCPADCSKTAGNSGGSTTNFCFNFNSENNRCECANGPSPPPQQAPSMFLPPGPCTCPNGGWCATSRGIYGPASAQACSEHCLNNAKSVPPFCMDYRADLKHCECSAGADIVQPNPLYLAFEYSCNRRRGLESREEFSHGVTVPSVQGRNSIVMMEIIAPGPGVSQVTICGNMVCETDGGEDGKNCAMDCCPTSPVVMVCARLSQSECDSLP
eukprot:gene7160-271_t